MKGPFLPLNYLLCRFILLLVLPNFCHAQLKIKVLDGANFEPLSGVEILDEKLISSTITDFHGRVTIDTSQSKVFRFDLEGYFSRHLSLKEIADDQYQVILTLISEELDEFILLGTNSFKESDQYHQVKAIHTKQIVLTNPQTSADILAQYGGVYVQKSQMGGGSPIIRGFEANRVLLVLDGVRLNNAIYRNGHLQNAITVDASVIEEMTVHFGPNSLAYGSDAIGGVVNFKTRNPRLSSDDKLKYSANAFSRYSSANAEKTGHIDFSLGGKKWGSLTSMTISDYADLRTGKKRDSRFPDFGKRLSYATTLGNGEDSEVTNANPNVQVGTAYHQYDVLQKFIFKPKSDVYLSANFQFSNTGNLPRYDNLQEIRNGHLRYSEWSYGPQTRLLGSLQFKNYHPTRLYDQYIITAAYQFIQENRIIRNFASRMRQNQNEDVDVKSFSAEFKKRLACSEKVGLHYGIDLQDNDVTSTSFNQDISTGEISQEVLTRYADGHNDFFTYGTFAAVEINPGKSGFSHRVGLRYSGAHYKIQYLNNALIEWPSSFMEGIEDTNTSLTWSVSSLYRHDKGWFARALISSAFRSPNIDDLSKIRVNFDEITFPNPGLKPERSTGGELSLGFSSDKMNFSSTAFYTGLEEAIVRRSFTTPSGESSYENFGEILGVVANQNVQSAYIYGLSLNLNLPVFPFLELSSSINLTKGKERVENGEDLPFAHIPPLYGQCSLRFEKEDWLLKTSWVFNGMKSINDFGGSVDNPELATPIGSLAWSTFNIYAQYKISPVLSGSLALENIFDKHYRPFSSGLSAPGRNFIMCLRAKCAS